MELRLYLYHQPVRNSGNSVETGKFRGLAKKFCLLQKTEVPHKMSAYYCI